MKKKFECKQCGWCCRFEGGVVLLSKEDLQRLSDWAQLTKEQFIKVYCRTICDNKGKNYLILKTLSSGDCIFWKKELCGGKGGCEAYTARPVQCSTYPFWTKILSSEENWNEQAKNCPGINCGKEHSQEEIQSELKKYQARIPLTADYNPL